MVPRRKDTNSDPRLLGINADISKVSPKMIIEIRKYGRMDLICWKKE